MDPKLPEWAQRYNNHLGGDIKPTMVSAQILDEHCAWITTRHPLTPIAWTGRKGPYEAHALCCECQFEKDKTWRVLTLGPRRGAVQIISAGLREADECSVRAQLCNAAIEETARSLEQKEDIGEAVYQLLRRMGEGRFVGQAVYPDSPRTFRNGLLWHGGLTTSLPFLAQVVPNSNHTLYPVLGKLLHGQKICAVKMSRTNGAMRVLSTAATIEAEPPNRILLQLL